MATCTYTLNLDPRLHSEQALALIFSGFGDPHTGFDSYAFQENAEARWDQSPGFSPSKGQMNGQNTARVNSTYAQPHLV